MDRKSNDWFDLTKLSDTHRESLEGSSNPMENVPKITVSSLLDTREACCSERIVRAPDRFMLLGEIVSDEHDLDPNSYNEAISNKDLKNWQSAMQFEDDVYIMELYDFIAKGQEHMVCKLHRSIFRLKQASRS